MASATKPRTGAVLCREYVFGTPLEPKLDSEQVHVFTIDLGANADAVPYFRSLLSVDEGQRADKFRFENGRNEYTITRGVLRTLLGFYLDAEPGRPRFRYSDHGKPSLDGEFQERLEFNVSHSGGMAIVAIAHQRRIGVDIERVQLDFEHERIAERFFSEHERVQLSGVAKQDLPIAFFRCWTRKEAFIKALGEGLSHPLSQFDVELRADQPVRLVGTRPDPIEASMWNLLDVPVPPLYVAALAMEDVPRLA